MSGSDRVELATFADLNEIGIVGVYFILRPDAAAA
jgi:hypothetical protein